MKLRFLQKESGEKILQEYSYSIQGYVDIPLVKEAGKIQNIIQKEYTSYLSKTTRKHPIAIMLGYCDYLELEREIPTVKKPYICMSTEGDIRIYKLHDKPYGVFFLEENT